MPSWSDKVQTSMHPQIRLFMTLRLLLLSHIRLMLVVDEVHNRRPRVAVVDIVAKAGRVNDGEFDLELLLLKLGLDDLDLGELVELLVVPFGVVFGW